MLTDIPRVEPPGRRGRARGVPDRMVISGESQSFMGTPQGLSAARTIRCRRAERSRLPYGGRQFVWPKILAAEAARPDEQFKRPQCLVPAQAPKRLTGSHSLRGHGRKSELRACPA